MNDNAENEEAMTPPGEESFYNILNEMKKYANDLTETVPVAEINKRLLNWADRIETAVMEIVEIDAHELCDACILIMKTIDGFNEGKIGVPGDYPSEEEQKYVADLKHEMINTINGFMEANKSDD